MKRKNHSDHQKRRKAPGLRKYISDFRLPRHISKTLPFTLLFTYVAQIPGGNDLLKETNYEQSIKDWADAETNVSYSDFADFTPLNKLIETWKVDCYNRNDLQGYRLAYQAEKLLGKFPHKGGNSDVQRKNAIDRFFEAEKMCRETNNRFRAYSDLPMETEDYQFTFRVKEIIRRILGDLDKFSLIEGNRAGPGLTNDLGLRKPQETTAFFKYHDRLTATANARYYTKGMVSLDHHWMTTALTLTGNNERHLITTLSDEAKALNDFVVSVPGNRITFVPKDTKTDRTIAIEPSGNIMLQLGVGTHIKNRLKSWGINLRSQRKNQMLAHRGSLQSGPEELSTIDLAMASDTVSFEVVKSLLPRNWFLYLSELRSATGTLKTEEGIKSIDYEKFSSMGNGYTFELESLIFFAITLACYEDEYGSSKHYQRCISVFGDDIVCPAAISTDLISKLSLFGFKVNEDKSFIRGKFKESCGKDFFLGHDVRPFFLRRHVKTLKDLHFVANSLAYKSMVHKTFIHENAYMEIFKKIPVRIRLPGPLHFIVRENWEQSEDTVTDSLESCLRVPWDWAVENGYYRFERETFGCMYTEVQVQAPKYSKTYRNNHPDTFENVSYHIFLQGIRNGDITLRGITRDVVKNRVTTNWYLPKQDLSKDNIPFRDSESRSFFHPLESFDLS